MIKPKKSIKEKAEETAPQEVAASPIINPAEDFSSKQEIVVQEEYKSPEKKFCLREIMEEEFNKIEYEKAYLSPRNYFVEDSNYGRVYKVGPPKNNTIVVNSDPTLGGIR
jgi:hypothetical protein